MTNAQNLIALERQRERIPTSWLITFEGMTNDELAYWASDDAIKPEVRAYCGWELDYRVGAGIEVYMHNTGEGLDAKSELRRRKVR